MAKTKKRGRPPGKTKSTPNIIWSGKLTGDVPKNLKNKVYHLAARAKDQWYVLLGPKTKAVTKGWVSKLKSGKWRAHPKGSRVAASFDTRRGAAMYCVGAFKGKPLGIKKRSKLPKAPDLKKLKRDLAKARRALAKSKSNPALTEPQLQKLVEALAAGRAVDIPKNKLEFSTTVTDAVFAQVPSAVFRLLGGGKSFKGRLWLETGRDKLAKKLGLSTRDLITIRRRRTSGTSAISAEEMRRIVQRGRANPKKKKRKRPLRGTPVPQKTSRKKITKKMMKPVIEVFEELGKTAATKHPDVALTKLEADAAVHDTPRHFGMAGIEKDGPKIKVAPELASRPLSEIRGVLAHELGHIIVLLGIIPMQRGHDACERQADKVAEDTFGAPIYYKANGVQCMGRGARGKRPRPKGLK